MSFSLRVSKARRVGRTEKIPLRASVSQEGNSNLWRRIRHDCCMYEPISGLPAEESAFRAQSVREGSLLCVALRLEALVARLLPLSLIHI